MRIASRSDFLLLDRSDRFVTDRFGYLLVDLAATDVLLSAFVVASPAIEHSIKLQADNLLLATAQVQSTSVSQVHQLDASNVAIGSPTLPSVAISYSYRLTASDVFVEFVTASPAIEHSIKLQAENLLLATAQVQSTSVSQVHQLDANGVAIGSPTLPSVAISYSYRLTVSDVFVEFVTASANISQRHLLGVSFGPLVSLSLASPSVTQRHPLAAASAAISALAIDIPAISQDHRFSLSDIALPQPAASIPSLAHRHVITAEELHIAAWSLASPDLRGIHNLRATSSDGRAVSRSNALVVDRDGRIVALRSIDLLTFGPLEARQAKLNPRLETPIPRLVVIRPAVRNFWPRPAVRIFWPRPGRRLVLVRADNC